MKIFKSLNVRITLTLITVLLANISFGQYKQKEYEKYPEQRIFPDQYFDSIAAKNALAVGTTTVTGVAFTKPKTDFGYKAPFASRIYANHIIVMLFPSTPYYQEWMRLKDKKENLKKNKIVFMDSVAYRYRLECETNSRGEFTFPKMKAGKYILVGTLPWTTSGSYNRYEGSGYNNYGGQTDYYSRQYYSTSHSDFLMQEIEVENGKAEVKVKLK
ncbi:MAG: hypothetical protein DI598_01215 [Pseudopedobacter saltans]|uniref:Carboxypeptidase regulatory-like domain-containing protein n=1 Tax=Pseudopedobacter saltans TaxID=151895 RepID=A0A2W5FEY2_9SPHI|nr:MAG: hypothetical protein DI598_01215 [Pseudopedobacter saltans]